MRNNFEQIKSLMSFNSNEDFYYIQIIKRRKENPDITTNCRIINSYIIQSIQQLDHLTETIISECKKENARAYITINKRNVVNIAARVLAKFSEKIVEKKDQIKTDFTNLDKAQDVINLLKDGRYFEIIDKYISVSSSLIGQYHSDEDKKWIIDCDKEEGVGENTFRSIVDSLVDETIKLQEETKKEPFVKIIETKNGCHIITRPFNLQKFSKSNDVKKDSPTILYIP